MTRPGGRRVALAIESSEPGGAENLVVQLADRLRERGHHPEIVTLEPGWLTERAEGLGLPVHLFPQKRGLDPLWPLRFAGWLRRRQIDLLHTHEFAMNVYGAAAARLAGRPSLGTIHGRAYVADRPRRIAAYRWLLRTGVPIVPVSDDLARYLAGRFGVEVERLEVVRPGIPLPDPDDTRPEARDRTRARQRLGLPGEVPLVVAVGSLFHVKGHDVLLRAAARLPGVHFTFAGEGDQAEPLAALARELGIAERVHWLGLRDDVPVVLRAADVFCQPSRSEGLPLAVLEAMAWGLPVVACRVGGMAEAVAAGETGTLVPPEDPAALADALAALLASGPERVRLGEAGRARVYAEFSLETMTDAYWRLYERLWRARGR